MAVEKIKRFLIVTTNDDHGQFYKVLLREKQISDISIAKTTQEALSIIEAKRIQFLIVYRELSEMLGTVFMQKVHAVRQWAHIPCLLYSEKLPEQSIRLCREFGIYVLKVPLEKPEVWPVIEQICHREETIDATELELRKVDIAIAEKQYKQALQLLKNVEKGVASARSQTLLGEVLMELEELEAAEKALTGAMSVKENHHPALQLLARLYCRTNRFEKATVLLTQMAESSPENIKTLLSLGATYSESEQFEHAKDIFQRVLSLDMRSDEARLQLGRIAVAQGNQDHAEQILSEVENASELGRFFNNMAIGLVNKKQIDHAVRTYQAAIRVLQDKQPALLTPIQYNLGLAMKKQKNLPLAFALLAAVCAAEPGFAKAFATLSRCVNDMKSSKIPYDEETFKKILALQTKTD